MILIQLIWWIRTKTYFFKKIDQTKIFQIMLYDHSIGVAYLGFHTLLYFEHRVFLAFDVFCYYNKGTQKFRRLNEVCN